MRLAVVFWLLLVFLLQAFPATPIEPLAQKWVARYNTTSNQNDFSSAVAVDSAGDIYTVGCTAVSSSEADLVLVKNDGISGTKLWEWHLNKPRWLSTLPKDVMPLVARLKVGSDGNPVVLVSQHLYKLRASDGAQVWSALLPRLTSYTDGYEGLVLDEAADVYVCGGAHITLKLSGLTGVKLWERRISRDADLEAIAVDADGNAFVTGSDRDKTSGLKGVYTAKYSGLDGTIQWEKLLADSTNALSARLITVDSARNPIVATTNGLILKYSGDDGSLVWKRQGQSFSYDLLCDSADDVVVASSTYTVTTPGSATLSKYAGTDGTQRWSKEQSGEFYCSLLLRGSEILVAGQRSDDLLLLAFDPISGFRRWEATYGAPGLKDRMASTYRPNGRIAVQPDGGVIITGCSEARLTGFDFATLRYAPGPTIKSAGTEWVLQSSAKLTARASANGIEASLFWEYGPTISYGQATTPLRISITGSPQYYVLYNTTIAGLPENTTFHARAVATSAAGITYGEDFTFTTGWDGNRNGMPDQWELDHWGNTSSHLSSADDDRDGLPSLLEYALKQNPRVPDNFGVHTTQVNGYLTATITKQPFVNYSVEASSNLQTWSTADTTVIVDDATTLTVRGNIPLSSGGAQFLRIRVTSH